MLFILKKNEILLFVATWISQAQKDKHYMISSFNVKHKEVDLTEVESRIVWRVQGRKGWGKVD
jgi:hypothetical protein